MKISWKNHVVIKGRFESFSPKEEENVCINLKIIISDFPPFSLQIKNGKTDSIPGYKGAEGARCFEKVEASVEGS